MAGSTPEFRAVDLSDREHRHRVQNAETLRNFVVGQAFPAIAAQQGVVEQTGQEETVHSYGWYLRSVHNPEQLPPDDGREVVGSPRSDEQRSPHGLRRWEVHVGHRHRQHVVVGGLDRKEQDVADRHRPAAPQRVDRAGDVPRAGQIAKSVISGTWSDGRVQLRHDSKTR